MALCRELPGWYFCFDDLLISELRVYVVKQLPFIPVAASDMVELKPPLLAGNLL